MKNTKPTKFQKKCSATSFCKRQKSLKKYVVGYGYMYTKKIYKRKIIRKEQHTYNCLNVQPLAFVSFSVLLKDILHRLS